MEGEIKNEDYLLITSLLEDIDEMIEYVENAEVESEWDKGLCRSFEELIKIGYVPKFYFKLLAIKTMISVHENQ